MHVNAKTNDYQRIYPRCDVTPKAVIAAVAISLALRLCDHDLKAARELVSTEWKSLNDAGIVPQKPVGHQP